MNKITRFCFNFTEHLDPVKDNPKSMARVVFSQFHFTAQRIPLCETQNLYFRFYFVA